MQRLILIALLLTSPAWAQQQLPQLTLNSSGYFEARGVNVFVFSNWYNDAFSDSKISGVEIIHHGVRTATNGDVRLSPTPGQWDSIPHLVGRTVERDRQTIEVALRYPAYNFDYKIRAEAHGEGIRLSVILDRPLPPSLDGEAGLNLEFLPSEYFKKAYEVDGKAGVLPLYPGGPMAVDRHGDTQPMPIAEGRTLTLAPEDPERRVQIRAEGAGLMLFDGRNKAQNGWFVVRGLLPAGRTGRVLTWNVSANVIAGWIRPPVIEYSQVGYHPKQKKVAVIEIDRNDHQSATARLLNIQTDGSSATVLESVVRPWGSYLRYNYATFDFSSVTREGLYVLEYGGQRTRAFRIGADVYESAWCPTQDVFFPVQMDHVMVNEAYRVWHGASHLDDALQAPVNHEHFDLYAQGPSTDSPYKPGQHIPGLNVGGWFDAGDFDIRTQSQYATVLSFVQTWELFHPRRDETSVNEQNRFVDIHHPDGKPDILQQIEHGTLQLLAQQKAVGHAISGIIAAHLSQYTHLGDAVTKTDNLIYDPGLDSLQSDGFRSGTFDDRWAFTTKSSALNYGSAAALAAASRALAGYNDTLAVQCLSTAANVWKEEHMHEPDVFRHGNTTGGSAEDEEFKAAVELLITTHDSAYADRIHGLWPVMEKRFVPNAIFMIRALPYLDSSSVRKTRELVRAAVEAGRSSRSENPFGVPISTGGWGGNGLIVASAITNYFFCKSFPDCADPEWTYRALNYLFGCHPGSNISFVSGVGTESKMIAYGNNRADFSFIAGGVVPGILVLKPDFPENKEDWPFLWGENEYVITLGANYIFLIHAAQDLLR